MKLPSLIKRKSLPDIAHEGTALQAHADAIAIEIGRLDAARPDVVMDGEPEDVAAHDAARSRLGIELEQATMRLGRLDGERQQAAADVEQERRRKVYTAAKKARTEGVTALADYERHARAAAAALCRLAEVEHIIASANDPDQIPDGAEPIAPAEPDNSVESQPDRYVPPERLIASVTIGRRSDLIADARMTPGHMLSGAPGLPHISILRKARIPGVGRDEMLFPPKQRHFQ